MKPDYINPHEGQWVANDFRGMIGETIIVDDHKFVIQSVGVETTPLQRRLDQLGKMLAVAALLIVALIFAMGWLQGAEFTDLFLTAVSLAVAAVPEAMTAIVTIALSLGAQRMLKRRALIRKRSPTSKSATSHSSRAS